MGRLGREKKRKARRGLRDNLPESLLPGYVGGNDAFGIFSRPIVHCTLTIFCCYFILYIIPKESLYGIEKIYSVYCLHKVSPNFNANSAKIIAIFVLHHIFSVPNSNLCVISKVKRIGVISEHKFLGELSIRKRKVIPHACVLYIFLRGIYHVVIGIGDQNVEGMF